jgi:hypothetical protein
MRRQALLTLTQSHLYEVHKLGFAELGDGLDAGAYIRPLFASTHARFVGYSLYVGGVGQ